MSIDRSTIIRGPAVVEFDSQVFYSQGDIIATPTLDTFDINTSIFGKVDERLSNIAWDIVLTPVGEWEALTVLFPYTNPTIGQSIFGASDKDLVIQSLAGQKVTFKGAAVVAMPNIICSATKTLLGQVTFRAIGANDTAWSDSAKRAAVAAQAFSDTSFDASKVKTQPYSVAWGSTPPWDDIQTEEGVTVSFDINLQDVNTDTDGRVDQTMGGVGVMARMIPVGISESQLLSLLKIQDTGIQRGVSLGGNKNDLVVTGTGVSVTVYDAAPKEAPFRWGQTVLRAGELGFVAIRKFSAGAVQALFAVSAS